MNHSNVYGVGLSGNANSSRYFITSLLYNLKMATQMPYWHAEAIDSPPEHLCTPVRPSSGSDENNLWHVVHS